MKRIVIYMLLAVFSLSAQAQRSQSYFQQLINQFSSEDGFSASVITKDMFDLYLKRKNVDSESTAFDAINNLDRIVVVSYSSNIRGFGVFFDPEKNESQEKDSVSLSLYNNILDHYQDINYTLLKTEKRNGEEVKVYLAKNNDKIESLAVLTNSPIRTNLVELQGDINLTAVANLNNALNLSGLENLNRINNSNNSLPSGYSTGIIPDMYFTSPELVEEMAARQEELLERQNLLSEQQRARMEEQAQIQIERQAAIADRYREMYNMQPIFLNYPGDSTIYYVDGEKVDVEEFKALLSEGTSKNIEIDKLDENGEEITVLRIKTK